ncbi:MAG: hypothetical protein PHU64_01770 [Candidatus Omnitrophica bacterium]|nr:hypothetical protein [Candidatus Omnitrophota bacterium]MDD5429232.1 hypothetical protein [Candidatus Omnitrophota bacterium]
MNVKDRIFLISGPDFFQRRRAYENIKKRIATGASGEPDKLNVYPKEADVNSLAEKLLTVPLNKYRIVFLKDFSNLAPDAGKFIYDNLNKILKNSYLIFETEKDQYKLQKDKKIFSNTLFKFILDNASLYKTASLRQGSYMEELIYALRKHDLVSSLVAADKLLSQEAKDKKVGPQIIGILANQISYSRNHFNKEKHLEYLWQADRAIKEKGLSARFVIETLLVKLLQ